MPNKKIKAFQRPTIQKWSFSKSKDVGLPILQKGNSLEKSSASE